MHIGYLVHDLGDAAVKRRTTMLQAAGTPIVMAGFVRDQNYARDQQSQALILGITQDAALGKRAFSVLQNAFFCSELEAQFSSCDLIIARNLECLILAHRIAKGRPVVYECLDIHHALLGHSVPHRLIQAIEGYLLKKTKALITSSPGFVTHYFSKRPECPKEIILLENKALDLTDEGIPSVVANRHRPIVVGWFGMLRCRKTLKLFLDLVARGNGQIKILIAGKPSPAQLPDFETAIAGQADIHFHGPYTPADLPSLYGQCHFAWCIDWYEEGQNSAWLLPNRLYEATAHGSIPIALADVETGEWLERHQAGLLLESSGTDVLKRLQELTDGDITQLQTDLARIPAQDLLTSHEECLVLHATLEKLR
jgi:succinoglycan biosynthesis protein ExoL